MPTPPSPAAIPFLLPASRASRLPWCLQETPLVMADPSAHDSSALLDPADHQGIRVLSRTPKPYHHNSAELPHPAERVAPAHEPLAAETCEALPRCCLFSKDSSPASDSGAEADDEHFLKGLPAPRARLHKGLRGSNKFRSGPSKPRASPALVEQDQMQAVQKALSAQQGSLVRHLQDAARRNKVLLRRAVEVCLVIALGFMVRANPRVAPLVDVWHRGMPATALCSALVSFVSRLAAGGPLSRDPPSTLSHTRRCLCSSAWTAVPVPGL